MTNHSRTLRTIGFSIAGLFAVLYFTISTFSRSDYSRLEQQETLHDILRVKGAIDTSLKTLNTMTGNYGLRVRSGLSVFPSDGRCGGDELGLPALARRDFSAQYRFVKRNLGFA